MKKLIYLLDYKKYVFKKSIGLKNRFINAYIVDIVYGKKLIILRLKSDF